MHDAKHNNALISPYLRHPLALIPVILLLCFLTLTYFAWRLATDHQESQSRERFEGRIDLVMTALEQRMRAYEQVLRGFGALLAASRNPTAADWRTYYQLLQIDNRLPGIQGVFYAPYVPATEWASQVPVLAAKSAPGWALWPSGDRDAYAPVIFAAPEQQNRKALGYDWLSEPRRRDAMEEARDIGHIVRTRAVTLVTETRKADNAFIVYLPAFRHGYAPSDVSRRREELIGFAGAVFRTEDLMRGLLGDAVPILKLQVYDGELVTQDHLLYDSAPSVSAQTAQLSDKRSLDVSRRPLTIRFTPLPAFFKATASREPQLVLIGGGAISVLVFIATIALTSTRLRAQTMAARMTEAFHQSERRLGLMIQQIDEYAIFSLDPNGAVSSWNSGAERIFGYQEASILGAHFSKFYSSDDVKAGKPHRELATAAEQGRVEDEGWRIRADGVRFWVNTVISPMHNAEGQLIGFAKITRDMTERRRAEQDREKSLALIAAQLKEIKCLYGVADSAAHASEIPELLQQVVDQMPAAFGSPDRIAARIVFEGAVYQSRGFIKTAHVMSADIILDDVTVGALFVYDVSAVDEGQPAASFSDEERGLITAVAATLGESIGRRKKQEELSRYTHELEAFSYSVSHDLRAPLRAMDGFARALVDRYSDVLDDQGRRYISRIRNGATRMGHLIDDLLRLSRITRAELRLQSVSLTDLAQAVHADLAIQHPSRHVTLTVQPELFAQADISLMRVALENLLGNAWKFTERKDNAKIEVGAGEGRGVFYVKDNGAGFDNRYADKLFIPFQRLHNEADFSGTGIGLAIVQRVLHRHGGRVWAEGVAGEGASFFFELPASGENDGHSEDHSFGRRQSG